MGRLGDTLNADRILEHVEPTGSNERIVGIAIALWAID